VKSDGTLVCSRCGTEIHVSGEVEMSIDEQGAVIPMFAPDIASTAILQAHRCEQ
jgi:enhancing lycopene biosynthesis protein 2